MKDYLKAIVLNMIGMLCLFANATAQHIQVEAKLDSTSIMMGDQTILHLNVRFPTNDSIDFPLLNDTIIHNIQIVDKTQIDTVVDKDDFSKSEMHQQITLTSFEAGSYTIPSFVFRTKTDSVKTDNIYLNVLPVKVDTSKAIYDIKQPFVVTYSWIDWLRDHWFWIVIPLIAALLIWRILHYLRKRPQKHPAVETPKPEIPAHQHALEMLNKLKNKNLWQRELVKQYYIELSDILREYLEKRYKMKAQEQTSAEILASMKYVDILNEDRKKLHQILILADLAKFAKEKPSGPDNEKSMENAVNFVLNTQKRAQLAEDKEESIGDELV